MNELGSNHFFKRVKHFGQQEKKKIQRILIAAKTNGFEGLKSYVVDGSVLLVRNKSSNDVGSNDPKFMEKIRYVRQHALWHIHSGFYNVDNEYPIFDGYKESSIHDLVSMWMLHYSVKDGKLRFVDVTPHPLDIFSINVS